MRAEQQLRGFELSRQHSVQRFSAGRQEVNHTADNRVSFAEACRHAPAAFGVRRSTWEGFSDFHQPVEQPVVAGVHAEPLWRNFFVHVQPCGFA